jgi:hypothetical protein
MESTNMPRDWYGEIQGLSRINPWDEFTDGAGPELV